MTGAIRSAQPASPSGRPLDFVGVGSRTPGGAPAGSRYALFDAASASSNRDVPSPLIQLAQDAPAKPKTPWSLPWPGGAIIPGTLENKAWTDDVIHWHLHARRAIGD